MSERQKASHPTAPIAWMSQAYDSISASNQTLANDLLHTNEQQPLPHPSTQHQQKGISRANTLNSPSSFSASMNPSSTITSVESFERPESPTLPPEQDLPLNDNNYNQMDISAASHSLPNSPTRQNYIDTTMSSPPPPPPPTGPYYSSSTLDRNSHKQRANSLNSNSMNTSYITPDSSIIPSTASHHTNLNNTTNTTTNTNRVNPNTFHSQQYKQQRSNNAQHNPATLSHAQQQQQHNNHHHHHHQHQKTSKRPVHMTDQMAAAVELSVSPNVPPAPAAGMYWSRALTYGRSPSRPLRAHSANLIGEYLYVFGGCDMKACFNTLYILDMDTLTWSKPKTSGQIPPPCRAHSSTTVERDMGNGKKSYSLYVFGGGDGPNYFNDLYVLDIDTLTWTKPKTEGEPPSPRRAHTTCIWNKKIIIVGGGDGARALADVHMLDLSGLEPSPSTSSTLQLQQQQQQQQLTFQQQQHVPKWTKLTPEGTPPIARGYHTSNLVKDKLIIYGGSDGHECFSDVYVLDLVANRWSQIDLDRAVPRLAHSATQVGSYVFVIGGHDGTRYSNEVLLLNLVTMSWETRKIYGGAPSPRGYHTAVLHDSRLYILGGYDGRNVFDDVYMLELSACAYLPQITNFEIDV